YPGTSFYDKLADGYFTAAREVAPDLPLALPEFGALEGPNSPLDEEGQAKCLERILRELAGVKVSFACWYSLYDQSYIGAPDWFRKAFDRIGLHRMDGSAKPAWAAWKAVK
ncbi:MAG: hypothetical protein ACYTAF_15290, partial [Planctomycetota bacterium]